MHGTRPNVLATAEKELQNGAEIIPRNKQIDVTNKIPVPDEDIIPKVSLKPLRSNQTQAAKNPVGSASQVAKTRQMQKPTTRRRVFARRFSTIAKFRRRDGA